MTTHVVPPLARRRTRRSLVSGAAALTAAAALAAAALATAAPAAADEVPGPGAPVDPQVLLVLERTNAARAAVGCAPLQLAGPLTTAADRHSAEMAATGTMTHTGLDGSTPRTRLAAVGVLPRRTAENVAFGYGAAAVVDAWMASPGHRANLLDCRLGLVGIAERTGATGPYWTQVLAGL